MAYNSRLWRNWSSSLKGSLRTILLFKYLQSFRDLLLGPQLKWKVHIAIGQRKWRWMSLRSLFENTVTTWIRSMNRNLLLWTWSINWHIAIEIIDMWHKQRRPSRLASTITSHICSNRTHGRPYLAYVDDGRLWNFRKE